MTDRGDVRHEQFEELISAEMAGELNEAERALLHAHLRDCDTCRATQEAFGQGRRLVAGLRHHVPPRDLEARVRSGIEGGSHQPVPWWRRPAAAFVGLAGASALTAGVLLALVIADRPQATAPVGQSVSALPDPSTEVAASGTPAPTPSPPVAPSTTPLITPPPSAPELTPQPEPTAFLAVTGEPAAPELVLQEGTSGDVAGELPSPPGPPIAASLSPDGEWLAYIAQVGSSGLVEFFLAPGDGGTASSLAQSVQGSAFLETLSWSPDGRRLAFTVVDDEGRSDVWTVDTDASEPEARQLSDTDAAVAGSFDGEGGLWISAIDDEAASYLIPAERLDSQTVFSDLEIAADAVLNGWFQPMVSPDGRMAIAWRGRFLADGEPVGERWSFAQGGAPYLITADPATEGATDEPIPLFGDIEIDMDAFRSAAIGWGPNSRVFAVWDAQWTGTPVADDPLYPDALRVYLGRVSADEPINASRALDAEDLPPGIARVVHVAVSPDGVHLAVTVAYPVAGELDEPTADLILVKRNTGSERDETRALRRGDGWNGPAIYPPEPAPGSGDE